MRKQPLLSGSIVDEEIQSCSMPKLPFIFLLFALLASGIRAQVVIDPLKSPYYSGMGMTGPINTDWYEFMPTNLYKWIGVLKTTYDFTIVMKDGTPRKATATIDYC